MDAFHEFIIAIIALIVVILGKKWQRKRKRRCKLKDLCIAVFFDP